MVGGLEPWNFMTFHILGISSSQLTNSIIFQRGRSTTNQYYYHNHPLMDYFMEPIHLFGGNNHQSAILGHHPRTRVLTQNHAGMGILIW